MECFFHGTPSGIDHSVIIEETALWFQRPNGASPQNKIVPSTNTIYYCHQHKHHWEHQKQVDKVCIDLHKNTSTMIEIGVLHNIFIRCFKISHKNQRLKFKIIGTVVCKKSSSPATTTSESSPIGSNR